jgi:hypothetical protein
MQHDLPRVTIFRTGVELNYEAPHYILSFFLRPNVRLRALNALCLSLGERSSSALVHSNTNKTKQTPWPLVRKRNIPTERPPLVGEI